MSTAVMSMGLTAAPFDRGHDSTPVQTYHINGATTIDSGARAACGGKRPMTATPLTTAAWPNGRTR
jgi:hypothetical protein